MSNNTRSDGQVIQFPEPRPVIEEKRSSQTPPAKPEPQVIEAELIDDTPVRRVDQPQGPIDVPRWQREVTRRPILYPALHRDQFADAVRFYLGAGAHWVRYHGLRLPEYLTRTVFYSPRGAWRVAGRVASWVSVAEVQSLKAVAVRQEDHANFFRHERVAASKARARRIVLAAMLAVALTAGLALWLLTPRWTIILGWDLTPGWALTLPCILGVAALGYVGRPVDRPLIGPAVVVPQYQKLTSELVVRALQATGIPGLTGKDARITFPAPITRDGQGWRADIDLPHDVTAVEVIDKRRKLSGGLRRPLGCVWPEPVSSVHEGRLVLWVGDHDLAETGLVRWALATSGRHDYFTPAPFGVDPRGRPVSVPLFQHNVLIGSLPGQGKTGAVRCLACAVALDPTVEMWLHELKGSGDLDPLECVCHRFVSGIDDESIGYAAMSLRLLRTEVMRRTTALKKIPRDLCPDKRVTREIANKRSLRLHPLVCIIDEAQNLFAHPDYGAQAGDDAEFIIKIGRAFGVTLLLATQRPDKDSLPTGVSGNVSIRFCLKVAGQVENDMILGTSEYKNGLRATMLRAEIDAGIGYLKGATAEPVVVRVAYLDQNASVRVAQRARAMREAAGTLSGHAIGDDDADHRTPAASLLDDLHVIFAHAERMWSEDICTQLAELRPDTYGGWTPDALAAALRPYALRTEQINMTDESGHPRNRRGLTADALRQALDVRAERRSLGQ